MDTVVIQLKIRKLADEAHAAGYREIAGKLHDIARELTDGPVRCTGCWELIDQCQTPYRCAGLR